MQRRNLLKTTLAAALAFSLATPALAALARTEHIYKDEKFSDHAPITVDYDFTL